MGIGWNIMELGYYMGIGNMDYREWLGIIDNNGIIWGYHNMGCHNSGYLGGIDTKYAIKSCNTYTMTYLTF